MTRKFQKHHATFLGGLGGGAIMTAIISLPTSLNTVSQKCTELLNALNP